MALGMQIVFPKLEFANMVTSASKIDNLMLKLTLKCMRWSTKVEKTTSVGKDSVALYFSGTPSIKSGLDSFLLN